MSSTSDAVLKAEIARLTGAINRHKAGSLARPPTYPGSRFNRSNAYVNPNYNLPKPSTIAAATSKNSEDIVAPRPPSAAPQTREVLIGGVTFQSSSRTLIRKDLPKSSTTPTPRNPTLPPRPDYTRIHQGTRSTQRSYKPKSSRTVPRNHNMSLANGRKPYRANQKSMKHPKYLEKQCSRFATTGVCQRGLTCPYQHDVAKLAICWPFLKGNCPNTAENCSLSHDPTPERTPLCVHFANNGRCKNGDHCLFPHVRVGTRSGVCRNFAVLGYCEKGLECDHEHVRECPDFADNGTCANPKCKLPHVIRANRNRLNSAAIASATSTQSGSSTLTAPVDQNTIANANSLALTADSSAGSQLQPIAGPELGDEYISLTFHESDGSVDEDDNDEDDDDGTSGEEGANEAGRLVSDAHDSDENEYEEMDNA